MQTSNGLFRIVKRRGGKDSTLKKDLSCKKKESFNLLAHITKLRKGMTIMTFPL